MELRHLRYFVAVAEVENVTRAAVKLRVSQPALSRQIQDLEDELGVLILARTAKSVRLTDAGRIFLDEARAVLFRAEAAVAAVREAAGGTHTELHVGYAPSLSVQILPGTLRSIQTQMPKVRVLLHDLSTEEMRSQLLDGTLQLALMIPPGLRQMRGLRAHGLASYRLCLAVALTHPFAHLQSISRELAAKEHFIAYTRSNYPDYHAQLADVFKTRLRIVEEHDSGTSLIAAVEAGRGAALVPSCMATFAGQRLRLIPLSPAPRALTVAAVHRSGPLSAAQEGFITAAKEAAKQ